MSSGNSGAVSNLRPFPRGVSGNPSGRPKSFARYIRNSTRSGKELVDFMLAVLREEAEQTVLVKADGDFVPVRVKPSVKDRLEAARWLADRGWGRVPDTEEHRPPGAGLSDEEILAKLLAHESLRQTLQRLMQAASSTSPAPLPKGEDSR
jgi:hypothetical protein